MQHALRNRKYQQKNQYVSVSAEKYHIFIANRSGMDRKVIRRHLVDEHDKKSDDGDCAL